MTSVDQMSANQKVQELANVWTPFALRVAATLGVPALIASGIHDLGELARACGANQDALGRLLRHLACKGLFNEPSPGHFELTETGQVLAVPDPVGLADWLDLAGPAARADLACTQLLHSVRTGEPAFAVLHGRTFWEDLDAEPAYQHWYDQVMIQEHKTQGPSVAALYDWASAKLVVDVGGGSGALLAEVLRAHPHLRAMLVDRTAPAQMTERRFADSALADRVEVSSKDFFVELPAGGDVYLVSRVLSDWDDAQALTILRRCAEACGTRGRVLVVELMHGDPFVPHENWFDLWMLAVVGGRERSADDLAALAREAGLPATRAIYGPHHLLLFECARSSREAAGR